MHPLWIRSRKWCLALSSGGIALGILQGLDMVNFANFWTNILITWLTIIVTFLLGGDVSRLTNNL